MTGPPTKSLKTMVWAVMLQMLLQHPSQAVGFVSDVVNAVGVHPEFVDEIGRSIMAAIASQTLIEVFTSHKNQKHNATALNKEKITTRRTKQFKLNIQRKRNTINSRKRINKITQN